MSIASRHSQPGASSAALRFRLACGSFRRTKRSVARGFACALCGVVLLAIPPANAQIRSQTPRLEKVNDRVYCATGYALGNLIYVITDKSVVVIDTSESPASARASLEALRKFCDKPVSYIIYTHFHGDHTNGAKAFEADKPQIIAQELHASEIAAYRLLWPYNVRLNALQFGSNLPDSERGIALASETRKMVIGYMPPTITFDKQFRFEEGGVQFELYHTPGETNDHAIVWLPGLKTLLPADLFYASFPMLASPMKPDRPVLAWAQALDQMHDFEAEYFVPSHGEPIAGRQEIHDILTNYAAAIRYVHDETVKAINRGESLEQVRQNLRLPEELARLAYLQPLYGRVEWGVNGAYRRYTGWYDMNPAHLNPGPTARLHRSIVEAAGGASPLVARAQKALAEGDLQLVLELTDIVLSVEPDHPSAHATCGEALSKLATAAVNGVERNIYRAGALHHQRKAASSTVKVDAR